MLYWVARQLRSGKWRPEESYALKANAAKAASFYRREHRRRAIVVPVNQLQNVHDVLRERLNGEAEFDPEHEYVARTF